MPFSPITGPLLDVRTLRQTCGVTAYAGGGLFPVLTAAPAGILILSYHRTSRYDAAGNYLAPPHPGDLRPTEILITRSHDAGLTWKDPYLLGDAELQPGSPFGKIVTRPDGTLLLPIYHRASWNGEQGRTAGVNFAECFCRMYNETYDHLPVTEYAQLFDHLTSYRS